jgi:predicted DNA-binding transcriptional regulator AlpA
MQQLLTVKDVAAKLRLSRSMIHKLCRGDRHTKRPAVLHPLRFGRCLRFNPEEIDALVKNGVPPWEE